MEIKKTMRSFKKGMQLGKVGVGAALRRPCTLVLAAILQLMPMLMMNRALATEVPRTCQTYILSIQRVEAQLEDGDSFSLTPDAKASVTLTPEKSSTLIFSSSASSEEQNVYFTQTYTLAFVPLSDYEWRCDSTVGYSGFIDGFQIPDGTEYERSESLVLDSTSIGGSARVRVADGGGESFSGDSMEVNISRGVYSAVFSVSDGGLAVVNSEPLPQEPDMDGFFPDDFDNYDGFEDIDDYDYDDYYDVDEEGTSPIVKIAAAAGGLAVLGGVIAAIVKAISAKAAAAAAAKAAAAQTAKAAAAQTAKAASAASEAASEVAAQETQPPERQKSPAKAAQPDIPIGAADYLGGPLDNPNINFEDATTCKLS